MGRLGAYYHPPSDRVVLPVLDVHNRVVFWQARAVDKRQPKYLAPAIDKTTIIARYGMADTVTLTEDLLSAYKVGLVGEGWSLMGTSINKHVLSALLIRGGKVNVWLDPDPPGRKAAAKVLAALRSLGIEARDILSDRDPKLLHLEQIKELI
jgi:DNA primase